MPPAGANSDRNKTIANSTPAGCNRYWVGYVSFCLPRERQTCLTFFWQACLLYFWQVNIQTINTEYFLLANGKSLLLLMPRQLDGVLTILEETQWAQRLFCAFAFGKCLKWVGRGRSLLRFCMSPTSKLGAKCVIAMAV